MSAASKAAEMVTAGMTASAVKAGLAVDEESARAAAEVLGEQAEAIVDAGEQPEVDERSAAPVFDALEPTLPPDLDRELNAPDFEAEAEQELSATPVAEEETYEYEEDSYLGNLQLQEERKKRLAAEKKAEWYENEKIKAERRRWEEEAKNYFPLSQPFWSTMTARSRREFLRACKEKHEFLVPYVKQAVDVASDIATSTAKEQAVKDWGKPTVSPTEATDASQFERDLETARATRDLSKVMGVYRKYNMREA